MVELRPVGLSEDGSKLLLADAGGREFAVPVDERLRSAVGGNGARRGQLEIEMDSALRPRDIQARIRAGASPEEVAQVAHVSVDRIMGYAVPVLAERQHVAERAQRSAVRRKEADGPGRLLGDAVAERLRSRNINAESADWDAWRREDGRWTITVRYHSGERERAATFMYDALGRYVMAEDDDARWLVGEPSTTTGPRPREKPARRLTAVSDAPPDAPAPDKTDADKTDADKTGADKADAEETDAEPEPEIALEDQIRTADLTAVADALRGQDARPAPEPGGDAERADSDRETRSAPAVRAKKRSRRGRASIPSWDEIMFGQQDGD